MEIIIDILLPVFGVVGLGWISARMGWFSTAAEQGVATFVFSFAVPLFLFRTLATTDLPDDPPWDLFATYYIPAFAVYGLGFLASRYIFKRDPLAAVLNGMGCAFSNTVLLALPLVLLVYGEKQALPFFLIFSVHGLIFFTGTTILAEIAKGAEQASGRAVASQVVKGLVYNPILLGLVAGLAINLTGVGLATPIDRIAGTMQGAVLPCALFILGASLRRYGFAGRLSQSIVQVSAKILIFPALVYVLGAYVFDLDPLWVQVAVVTAAQPSGVMTFVFAEKYGTTQALATTSIFLGTVMSVPVLWAIFFLFQQTG